MSVCLMSVCLLSVTFGKNPGFPLSRKLNSELFRNLKVSDISETNYPKLQFGPLTFLGGSNISDFYCKSKISNNP